MQPDKYHYSLLALQVEKHLQHAIALYQNLPETDLLRKPHPDAWSATECLWHLNSYSKYYLPEIEKVLFTAPESIKEYNRGWPGRLMENMMNPAKSNRRFKAFSAHVPPPQLTPYAEVGSFIDYQEHLLKLLHLADKGHMNKRISISISRLVKLRLVDIFPFMIAHDERHLQQADRAIQGLR